LHISLFKEYKENPAQTLIQCITSFHVEAAILPVSFPRSVVLCGYSSTTKAGRNDIVDILQKVALKHQKSKSKSNENTK
jgi:hypothetical protein